MNARSRELIERAKALTDSVRLGRDWMIVQELEALEECVAKHNALDDLAKIMERKGEEEDESFQSMHNPEPIT